jgi:Tol biopolymer transport system component
MNDKVPFQICWSPDGRWIFMTFLPRMEGSPNYQIGAFSYPDGQFRRITNDTNDYGALSLSADALTLATVQSRVSSDLITLSSSGMGPTSSVPGLPRNQYLSGFEWTADDELLVSDGSQVRRMNADGGNSVTIAHSSDGWIQDVVACNARRLVAFIWIFHGGGNFWRIWRANSDGSDAKPLQVVAGSAVLWACSPDGKFLYYTDLSRTNGMLRLPMDGGTSEIVPGSVVSNAAPQASALSPDGKILATFLQQVIPQSRTYRDSVQLLSLQPGDSTQPRFISLDPALQVDFQQPGAPTNTGLHFTPDGKALAFVVLQNGADNVWIQPLDGSKPHQLTKFDSELIQDFRWSSDGKRLAVLRFDLSSDIILLHDSGPPRP